jgi:hypothetical protein
MKIKIFIAVFFLIIMISCNNKKEIPQTPELNNKKETSEIKDDLLPEFDPKYILLTNNIFENPDINSKRIIMGFSFTDLIQVLEYGENISVNNEYRQWVKIRDDFDRIGWCFNDGIKELKQPIKYNPMNKIDIEFLILTNIDGNNKFKIAEKHGDYSCEYGMNKIYISFYNRNEDFDQDFQYFNFYFPDDYRKMELCIDNDVNIFPSIYFSTNQRKNMKNNITFVDAFMFCAHESQDQEIRRVIYFTTNNYDIEIIMLIPGSSGNNEIIRKIMTEAPQYFLLYKNDIKHDYNGEDPRSNTVVWSFANDGIEKFGKDLIIGKNPSKTLMQWYNETEKILEGLRIE